MIGLLVFAAFAQGSVVHGLVLPEPVGTPSRLMMSVADEKLDPPKSSPKQKWLFEWLTEGFVQLDPASLLQSRRLRVFSQEHRSFDDKAPMVARMALRLWEYNFYTLRLDHAAKYNRQVVDFYLCFGGRAGGEQLFGEDNDSGKPFSVNTVYIYDLNSFASPTEMAREVAHEYGHATLPPIGGYKEPEYWASGYLGEKLYLRYLRDSIAANKLAPDDAMGADLSALNRWVKANVDPLLVEAAAKHPKLALAGSSHFAMREFLGLVLLMQSLLPSDTFARSLQLIGSQSAADYPDAVIAAIADKGGVEIHVPADLRGKKLWIPIGSGTVTGAVVAARQGGWGVVNAPGATLHVTGVKLPAL